MSAPASRLKSSQTTPQPNPPKPGKKPPPSSLAPKPQPPSTPVPKPSLGPGIPSPQKLKIETQTNHARKGRFDPTNPSSPSNTVARLWPLEDEKARIRSKGEDDVTPRIGIGEREVCEVREGGERKKEDGKDKGSGSEKEGGKGGEEGKGGKGKEGADSEKRWGYCPGCSDEDLDYLRWANPEQ